MSDTSVLVRLLALGFIGAAALPSPARAQTVSAPVPIRWVSQDVGLETPASPVQFTNDRLVVSAGAAKTPGAADQFRFVYQMLSGDVKITARLDSLTPAHLWSNAGLMIRSSLEPDAAHGAIMVRGDAALALQTRTVSGALTTSRGSSLEGGGAAQWLGLERAGSRVTAYTSADGKTWTAIGSEAIELGEDVYVGIAVSSDGAGESAVAQLSQLRVGGLPAGMRRRNIGGAAIAGTAWQSEGTYALTARGVASEDAGDRLHFAYQRVQGDLDVVARVASLAAGASAGVMIRESLAADSPHVGLLVSETNGYAWTRRGETGLPERTDGGRAGTPAWVKLVRSGTQVEVFRSDDGLTWTSIGTAPIASSVEVYVGLAISGGSAGVEARAVLDHVSVESAGVPALPLPLTLPPLVSLTSPNNGATFTAPATITLSASALDPELRMARVEFHAGTTLLGSDTSSPYSFTWASAPAGTHTLKAVAFDADGGQATSSTVTITVQPGANQAPAATLTSPANGATFTAPAAIDITATASDPENQLARVEFYQGTTLLGTDTSAPYSFTWSSAPAGSYALTARAIDAAGAQTTSSAVSITVEAPNQPPTVTISSPANAATFTAPATVTLSAAASDPENRLARVEFYQGTTLLGTDTSSPYSFAWSSVPDGSYTLTAKAFDSDGGQATSAAVTITVSTAPPPAPRLVQMTASTDHDDTVTSYLLEVFASGADPETASPVASSSLGKPTPDTNREISVDRASFFAALAPGNYIATVKAIGSDSTARSTAVVFTR
jgi:hypothetical protein